MPKRKKDTVRSLRAALRDAEAVRMQLIADLQVVRAENARLAQELRQRPAYQDTADMLKARTQFLNALGQGLAALADAGKMTVGKGSVVRG